MGTPGKKKRISFEDKAYALENSFTLGGVKIELPEKEELKLYIAQGRAYQKFLEKVDLRGIYQEKILALQACLAKAEALLCASQKLDS